MHSRAPRMLLPATAALTAGSVAYAVLTLPEPGDLRHPVVPFAQWAEQQSIPRQAIAEQCATVNETAEDRAWCLRQHVGDVRRRWRASQAATAEAWLASEISTKRDLYLVVGAYILFTLAIILFTLAIGGLT